MPAPEGFEAQDFQVVAVGVPSICVWTHHGIVIHGQHVGPDGFTKAATYAG